MIEQVEMLSKKELQSIIGGNIRAICKKKNIKMMDLAEQVDISYEYLRHIVAKNGKKGISLYSIYKFAVALNVSMDELFSGAYNMPRRRIMR